MRIDAHQHYWRPERGDYPWMSAAPRCLHRAFEPNDLAPLLAHHHIDATVLVQAAPTAAETFYMLGLADTTPAVAGVVGWVDFEVPAQRTLLEQMAGHPRLVGVRPMVQDITDDDWVLRPDIEWAFGAIQELGLCFDALGYPRHVRRFLTLAQRHPDLRMVLDHGLKPNIAHGEFDVWAADMRDIANHTQALCKLSGLATEAGATWTPDQLRPYIEHLVKVFGPARLMWGSDWPVSTSAVEYGNWLELCQTLLAPLGEEASERVFGANALEFYQIDPGDLEARLSAV